ncbi:MAG: RsmE family RNA methyltransferase, partial [Bacteroidota bacterium]
PKLNPLTKLTDFLAKQDAHSQRFIAHCADDSEKQSLKYNYKSGTDVCILVGPEGDFSDEEIRQALRQGFRPVSLGNSRLRTETAGIAAVHTINLLNE